MYREHDLICRQLPYHGCGIVRIINLHPEKSQLCAASRGAARVGSPRERLAVNVYSAVAEPRPLVFRAAVKPRWATGEIPSKSETHSPDERRTSAGRAQAELFVHCQHQQPHQGMGPLPSLIFCAAVITYRLLLEVRRREGRRPARVGRRNPAELSWVALTSFSASITVRPPACTVGETVILLHPHLPLSGVLIGINQGVSAE